MSFKPYITFSISRESVSREDYKFDCDPVVHAQTALFGLMYWNATQAPQTPLPELPDFMKGRLTCFDTGQKCIGPEDSETLLAVAASVCERKWNKSPFLFTSPDGKQTYDIKIRDADDEARALHFLKWLRVNGYLTKLKVKGEEYEGIDECN